MDQKGNHMARVTRAASHLSAEEVKRRLKYDPRPWCRGCWLIIYNALVEPRKAEEIAKHCGVSKGMVHQVISTYNRFGVEAIKTLGKGGRRHQYLTFSDQEQAVVATRSVEDERPVLIMAAAMKAVLAASAVPNGAGYLRVFVHMPQRRWSENTRMSMLL